jgi:hypothetical protein
VEITIIIEGEVIFHVDFRREIDYLGVVVSVHRGVEIVTREVEMAADLEDLPTDDHKDVAMTDKWRQGSAIFAA